MYWPSGDQTASEGCLMAAMRSMVIEPIGPSALLAGTAPVTRNNDRMAKARMEDSNRFPPNVMAAECGRRLVRL